MASAVRVEGLNELLAAFRKVEGDLAKDLRRELVAVGKPVADDARGQLSAYNTRSAAGIRSRLRGATTVVVEQRRGRTTGKRPDWGSFQMRRILLPALDRNQGEIVNKLEGMLDGLGRKAGF